MTRARSVIMGALALLAVVTVPLSVSAMPMAASAVPQQTAPRFVQVGMGDFGAFGVGLTASGEIYTWGSDADGELGNGEAAEGTSTPTAISVPIAEGDRVVQISVGAAHSLALTETGKVFAWGDGDSGQLGDGLVADSPTPIPVSAFPGIDGGEIVQVAAGSLHSLALTDTGAVYAWGWNSQGQVGNGTTNDVSVPERVIDTDTQNPVESIAAGNAVSFAVLRNGYVTGWGVNVDGRLGDGSYSSSREPGYETGPFKKLGSDDRIVTVAAGAGHGLALSEMGKLYAWGLDDSGQLGLGAGDQSGNKPVLVTATGLGPDESDTIVGIVAGDSYSAAITASGALYTWGFNDAGQLGLGDRKDRQKPIEVTSFPEVRDGSPLVFADSGYLTLSVVSETGGIYSAGSNEGGKLGNSTLDDTARVKEFANIRLGDLSGSAAIVGTPAIGVPTSAELTGWNPGGVAAYQWKLDDVDIPLATEPTYTPIETDARHGLSVDVTVAAENWSAASTTTLPVDVAGTAPKITTADLGSAIVGDEEFWAGIDVEGTGPLTFSATLPAGLTIDQSTGEITGAVGTVARIVSIPVSVSNEWGTDEATLDLEIQPGPTQGLTLTPSALTAHPGDVIELRAMGVDEYGNETEDLSTVVVYSSSVETDTFDVNRVTFASASEHVITATLENLSASVTIQIVPVIVPDDDGQPSVDDGATPDELAVSGTSILAGGLTLGGLALALGALLLVRARRRHTSR